MWLGVEPGHPAVTSAIPSAAVSGTESDLVEAAESAPGPTPKNKH